MKLTDTQLVLLSAASQRDDVEKARGGPPKLQLTQRAAYAPRYDSFDQYFLITAGFVPIFVTLHFQTFATISAHLGRHGSPAGAAAFWG